MSAVIRKVIRVDGTEEALDGPQTLQQAYKLIGCDTVGVVMLADRKHVMLVDDNGLLIGLPRNEKATALYLERCRPGATGFIVGDVVIVPDSDFGGR